MKRLWYLLLALLFGIILIVFFLFLSKDPNLATAILAFATVILAIATLLSIVNTNEQEKHRREDELQKEQRGKEERLLNEIIEWAIDVSNCQFMTDVSDIRQIASKYMGTEQEGNIGQKDANYKKELQAAMIVEMGNMLIRYQSFIVRNLYIVDVADTFGGDLRKATNLLCIHVQAHTILLQKLTHQYNELHEERVDKHSQYLEQYAMDVTKEAVKLKRKDKGSQLL